MRKLALPITVVTLLFAFVPSFASASTPEPVTITANRSPAGDFWSASGAFTDSGTLADAHPILTRSGTFHIFRTWSGSSGTFTTRANVKIIPTDNPDVFAVIGRWAVTSGTAAYATLHGTGTLTESFNAGAGTIVGTWAGSVHFD